MNWANWACFPQSQESDTERSGNAPDCLLWMSATRKTRCSWQRSGAALVDFFEGAKFCSETGGLKWKGSKLCNSPIFQELDTQNCQILLSQVGLRIWPIAKCFQVSDTSNLAASYVLYTLYIYIHMIVYVYDNVYMIYEWLCMYMILCIHLAAWHECWHPKVLDDEKLLQSLDH